MTKSADKGRWIPQEFFKLPSLSCLDRLVLSCIRGLDTSLDSGCFCNDQFIADLIAVKKTQVHRSIMKMHRLGYIQIECERGAGIHGTKRKIYCNILTKTTSTKTSSDLPTTGTNSSSGIDQKRPVVFEGVQLIGEPTSTVFLEDTVDTQEKEAIAKAIELSSREDKTDALYQTRIQQRKMDWTPKLGAHLSEFAAKAIEYGKPLQFSGGGAWSDEQFNRLLHRHGKERLEVVLKVAVKDCKYDQLSTTFFLIKADKYKLDDLPAPEKKDDWRKEAVLNIIPR